MTFDEWYEDQDDLNDGGPDGRHLARKAFNAARQMEPEEDRNEPALDEAKPIHPIYAMGRTDVAEQEIGPTVSFVRFEGRDQWFYLDSREDPPGEDGIFLTLKERLIDAYHESPIVQQAFDSMIAQARHDGLGDVHHPAELQPDQYIQALEMITVHLLDHNELLEEHVEELNALSPQPIYLDGKWPYVKLSNEDSQDE